VHDLLTDYHLFTVEDVLQSYEDLTLTGGTTDDVFEATEIDDMEMSGLVVEYLLTDDIREKMGIQVDHHDKFLDFHGEVLFLMALDVCNASVYFDIEGAQEKLDGLTLNDFPGENLTEFVATTQKYVNIIQGGYALPIHVGSKLLMKCTKTECEFFNRKEFNFLDRVKGMEDGYKLADTASTTQHTEHTTLGPIGIITWVQREHTKFVRDHDWPAPTTTLPQSNNVLAVDNNYRNIMT
jgi:hypothetical protein